MGSRFSGAAACIVVSLLASGCGQSDANQFDLICEGVSYPSGKPAHMRVSVDLKRMQFCYQSDGCDRVSVMASLTPTEYVFFERNSGSTNGAQVGALQNVQADFRVDRASGAYSNTVSGEVVGVSTVSVGSLGKCKRASFTPMGNPKL